MKKLKRFDFEVIVFRVNLAVTILKRIPMSKRIGSKKNPATHKTAIRKITKIPTKKLFTSTSLKSFHS